MAWYDSALSWLTSGNNASNLMNVGTGIYDLYNRSQVQDQLNEAATSHLVDPFGADNRNFYQGQLRNLYANPNYLQNLPGYQFSLGEMTRGVNREAARGGHYLGTKRLHDLMERTHGLASQTYASEADRLANLSGAQFAPNASAYANLTGKAAAGQAAEGSSILDIGKKAFELFNDASGAADSASGGEGDTLTDQAMDKVSEWLGGEVASGAVDLTASDLAGSSNLYGDAPAGSGGELTPTEFDAGVDSGYGDYAAPSSAPFSSYGGFTDFGQGANQVSDIAQYNAPVEGLSQVGAGAAAAGGALGAYGLTEALGGSEELGGGVNATNAIGGVAGSAAGGAAAGAMGATAGGAAGGAAAGGAAAGPLIPVALAMMAYGGITEGKAMDRYKGQVFGNIFDASRFDPSDTRTNDTGNQFMRWRAPTGDSYYVGSQFYNAQDTGSYLDDYELYDEDDQGRFARVGAWNVLGGAGGMQANPFGSFIGNDVLNQKLSHRLENKQMTEGGGDFGTIKEWAGIPGNELQAGGNTGSVQWGDTTFTPEPGSANAQWLADNMITTGPRPGDPNYVGAGSADK